jgi:hypothetical protein
MFKLFMLSLCNLGLNFFYKMCLRKESLKCFTGYHKTRWYRKACMRKRTERGTFATRKAHLAALFMVK